MNPTPQPSPTPLRQRNLPLGKAARIAWRGIRVRIGRSILVTAGIILPIAFLMYIFVSDRMAENVPTRGSREMVRRLMIADRLPDARTADAAIQTRWMVGLALLISFVGILNAMLMSVTERFREIGTMKCLGALNEFIVRLFLLESCFQGTVGTLTGVALGYGLAVAEGLSAYGPGTLSLLSAPELTRFAVFTGLAGIGLTIAGAVYPAMRAARMKPIDAMRTEI